MKAIELEDVVRNCEAPQKSILVMKDDDTVPNIVTSRKILL